MDPIESHRHTPKVSFDGGDLDCGNGLLLLIRKHLDPLSDGELMEVLSIETSVEEDLPAWCRLTGNQLVSWTKSGRQRSYLISRGEFRERNASFELESNNDFEAGKMPALPGSNQASKTGSNASNSGSSPTSNTRSESQSNSRSDTNTGSDIQSNLGPSRSNPTSDLLTNRSSKTQPGSLRIVAQTIPPLAVMGVGSWPRPVWLLPYLHKFLENKISQEEFNKVADDAVKLCVQSQLQAGVTVLTDGEARRDNYASFVGSKLNGCQLIPLTDLLPLVDDPDKFKQEMQSLDVPAEKVRHPAVFGKLSRRTSLAGSELQYLGSITEAPLKVALPGPYLLTRLMWMDCITDKVYKTRDELAQDVIAILREEIAELIQLGASIIQLDEPVLTEVVFTGAKSTPSFMCGALSERGSSEEELSFAGELINAVCEGFPKDRLALHVCRGNWTPDEKMALAGDYKPLLPLFNQLKVGRLLLEFCTPRAGDLHVIKNLRSDLKLGLGVLNPKTTNVESVESIVARVNECIALIGVDRITLNPDCGFATFADNPVNSADIATAKLAAAGEAAAHLRKQHNISG